MHTHTHIHNMYAQQQHTHAHMHTSTYMHMHAHKHILMFINLIDFKIFKSKALIGELLMHVAGIGAFFIQHSRP